MMNNLSSILLPATSSHALLGFSVIEMLFLVNLYLYLKISISQQFNSILLYSSGICFLSILVTIFFSHTSGPASHAPAYWGSYTLSFLGGILFYRLPFRWCGPFMLASLIASIMTHTIDQMMFLHVINADSLIISYLLIVGNTALLCLLGWFNRNRVLLLCELPDAPVRPPRGIPHTEERVIRQERARIARDIHDVLTHSLTILSIQVQATRQLLHQSPECLATKLDEIALLLRESITKSREVVNLLRDPPSEILSENICTHLHEIIERFSQCTGIHCIFTETDTQQEVSNAQDTTLRYALQEALTNAHRHGAAHTIWIDLRWQKSRITLCVRDDGRGADLCLEQIGKDNGHYGLQGMQERVQALGGELKIATPDAGGFMIKLTLP